MNRGHAIAAGSLLWLSGCFLTHGEEDGGSQRDMHEAPEPTGKDGARNEPAAISGHGGSGAEVMEPGLQVWVGAVRRREGVALNCSANVELVTEARALLLVEIDARGLVQAASLTVGEGPPLPPVADPRAYYPPGPPWTWHGCPMRGLVAGFEYPVYDARLARGRLSGGIHPADVVKPWCELQPSYAASALAAPAWGEYLCRPTEGIEDLSNAIPDPSRNAPGPSPFVPEELCFNVNAPCVCDADSCTASPYGAFPLDIQLTETSFSGRFATMDIKLERRR
jgi:hypothetical protein